MDMIFFCIYALEVIVKIISYGVDEYFQDSWNSFDFFLVIFQLVFDYILYNILSQTLIQSFKANRLLKLAKIQKVFRLFRAFRTIKVSWIGVYVLGAERVHGGRAGVQQREGPLHQDPDLHPRGH